MKKWKEEQEKHNPPPIIKTETIEELATPRTKVELSRQTIICKERLITIVAVEHSNWPTHRVGGWVGGEGEGVKAQR